jgi:hypothetical protein
VKIESTSDGEVLANEAFGRIVDECIVGAPCHLLKCLGPTCAVPGLAEQSGNNSPQ